MRDNLPKFEGPYDFRVLARNFRAVKLEVKCNGHNLPIPDLNFPLTARLEKYEFDKNTLILYLIFNCDNFAQSALAIASVTKTTEIDSHQPDFILLGRTLGQTAEQKIQLLPFAILDFEQEFDIAEALEIELIKQLFWDKEWMQKIDESTWVLIFKKYAIDELHKKLLVFHHPLFLIEHLDHTYPTLICYTKLRLPLMEVLSLYQQIPDEQKKYSEIITLPATCPAIDHFLREQAPNLDPITYCTLLQILNYLDLGITLKDR